MGRSQSILPEDMVVQILYWLPVISLLRFRSVCKSWLSLTSDPKFVQKHLYCSQIMARKKASLLMIGKSDQFNDRALLASLEFDCYLLMSKFSRVIGSCNGIICLVHRPLQYVLGHCHLWNPSTQQGMIIPEFPYIGFFSLHYELRSYIKFAFGFDTISNDYKVLILVPNPPVPILQIYSTNTSSWKTIHVHDTHVSKFLSSWSLKLGPIINGVLYMGLTGNLVSFNLQSEVFTVISFPNSMLRQSDILEFESSVAVIFGSDSEGSGISLWTLDGIRDAVSWTKKFFVRDDIHWVYSYLGGGLFLGRKECESIEVLYADKDKEVKFSQIPATNLRDLRDVHKYTETLVSIEGFVPMHKLVPWIRPQI